MVQDILVPYNALYIRVEKELGISIHTSPETVSEHVL